MKNTKKISVSELKVHALQIVETVRTTQKEVEIYKRGKLVARMIPAAETSKKWLGCLDHQVVTSDDPDSIIEPIDSKWDAMNDEDSF